MNFNLKEAIEVLERTPKTLESLLVGLSDDWLQCNEGEGKWNSNQVIDHLIECEKSNWIPRIKTILEEKGNRVFPPFDRDAHLSNPSETLISEKLEEFKRLRARNIEFIRTEITADSQFELTGEHPSFGKVKMRELLSTWVVHDLTHVAQIVRVMSERYREDVGPWVEYLSVLKG